MDMRKALANLSILDSFEEKYDTEIVHMVTSLGITTEDLERCDNYTKMFIYFATTVVVQLPVSKFEADIITNARMEYETLAKKEHMTGLTKEEAISKEKISHLLNEKIIWKDGKYYKEVTYQPLLNNLFFNVEQKPNAGKKSNGNRVTVDPDKKKWAYKTWVFTNIDVNTHTVHYMDRTNRPGLAEYKKVPDITFAALNIPRHAKGVFIVKDSVLARPDFKEVGLQKNTGMPFRSFSNIQKLKTSIAGANSLYSDSNNTLYYNQMYSPILRPNTINSDNYLVGIENTIYKDTYLSVTDDPLRSPIAKSKFVQDCYKSGTPIAYESANIFESGIDSKYLMEMMSSGSEQDKIAIKRWRSIVKSHYDNRNMITMLHKDDKFNQNEYNAFIRHYVGRVSNYVIKDPVEKEEIDVACPYEHSAAPYLDLSESFIKLPPNEEWKLSSKPHLYSDILRMEDQLSGQSYVNGRLQEARDIIVGIKETRQEMFNHNGYTNGISFEDIIFIPVEKIIKGGGEYYDEESDLVIVLDNLKGSECVIHPYSKKRRELERKHAVFEATNIGVGGTVKIISCNPQDIGKVFYIKLLNKIYHVPVEGTGAQPGQIIITSRETNRGLPEVAVYPLTKENMAMLNIFETIEDAECQGLREENLKRESYNVKLMELDADKQITQMNLEKAKIEFTNYLNKLSLDIAAKKVEYKLKLEDAISKSMIDAKTNELKLQKEKYSTLASVIKATLDAFNITTRFIEVIGDLMRDRNM